MAEAAKTSRVTNAELLSEVLSMQKQLNSFMAADGWGGRILALEKENAENCKDITSLQHEISGNGKPGIKKDMSEVKTELLEVKHSVQTILSITRWVMTPVFVALVGVIFGLIFNK